MVLNSITSWLCSQGYHRPSHSSPGPLLMSSRSSRPPSSLIDGASICIKKHPQHIPNIFLIACVTPHYPSSRCWQVEVTRKKQCFQSSFLQFSKEGFIQFLCSIRQSAVDAHWDTFMLDSPLILTGLLLFPKQIWLCKFKPLFGVEHKPSILPASTSKESVFIHCSTSFVWAIPHHTSVTLKRSCDGTQTSYSSFLLPMHCVFLYRYLRWATRESVKGSLIILPFKYFSGPYPSTSLGALVSIPGKPRLKPFSRD